VVFGLIQYFFADLQEISLGRAVSTFGQPDYFAYYIILLIFPLVSSFVREKKSWKILLLVLSLVALVFTESRGAFVGIFAGILSYMVMAGFILKKKKLLVSAMIVAVAAGSLFYSHSNFLLTRSTETRLRMWNSSLEMIQKKPMFGYGPETFPMAFQSFADPQILGLEKLSSIPDKAHNILIELLVEGGVLFLAFFVLAFGGILTVALKSKSKDKLAVIGILSSLIAAFVANQFGFFAMTHFVIATFLLAKLTFYISKGFVVKKVRIKKFVEIFLVIFVVAMLIFQNLFVLIADHEVTKGFGVNNYILATTLNPNQRDYNYILAMIFNDLGDTKNALYYAEKGGKFAGYNDPYYYFLLGKILKSESNFEKAFKMAPTYPPILLEWGKLEVENGDCRAALEKFDSYLQLVPNYWQSDDAEQKRLFYKENPTFDLVFQYIDSCKGRLKKTSISDII
ncbi:MAG: O-antigen ligase family protein, partial [Candidatus Gracilibacteria bacterium]